MLLLHGIVLTAKELTCLTFCGLYYVVLENDSVQNSHRRCFGSPMSNDSTTLNNNTFNVTYIAII